MLLQEEFRVGNVFQNQWGVRGRNTLIMLAVYLGGVGAGLYLVSLLVDYWLGAFIGVCIVAIGKSAAHILFLGRPDRFWRVFRRPHSSWISRGVIFFTLFVASGLAYLLPEKIDWVPWGTDDAFGKFLLGLSVASAFLTAGYTGLLMNRTAISFWNNPLLAFLFLGVSLWSGASLAGVLHLAFSENGVDEGDIRLFALWAGVGTLSLLAFYYYTSYSLGTASRPSIQFLGWNSATAWLFYGVFLGLGLGMPLTIYAVYEATGSAKLLMDLAMPVEIVVGGILFRYTFFRAGMFRPVY